MCTRASVAGTFPFLSGIIDLFFINQLIPNLLALVISGLALFWHFVSLVAIAILFVILAHFGILIAVAFFHKFSFLLAVVRWHLASAFLDLFRIFGHVIIFWFRFVRV